MTAPVVLGLARVTVLAPTRRIDVALPDSALVVDILPHLLRLAGEELADEGEKHGGWRLRRTTGAILEPTRNLPAQGVRDGELLHLVPRRMDWPEPAYDDIVEMIASGARRTGRSWGNHATRRFGLALTCALLLLGLVSIVVAGPPWLQPASLAVGLAASLAVIGLLLARALADAVAGAAVAASGMPYAFVGGALMLAPGDAAVHQIGAPGLLLGSAALLIVAVIGYTGVAALPRLFLAGVSLALVGALGALVSLAGATPAGAAALVLLIAIGALPGYPLLASWLGKLPIPELPSRPEEILEDRTMPGRSDIFATVNRATEMLTGLLLFAAVASIAATVVLVSTGGSVALWLALVGASAQLLRARLFPTPRQRLPLLVGGMTGFVTAAFIAAAGLEEAAGVILVMILAAAGAVVLTASLIYSRRTPSPYVGRAADIIDVVAIMALVPLTSGVLGLFGAIQGLFASIGG